MSGTLTVALLQALPRGADADANAVKGEALCREAARLGADVALFPEMWSAGYTPCPADPAGRLAWQALAVGRESAFVGRFRALAKELGMAIAVTCLESWPGAPRNSVFLVDRHGEIVLAYAKVHTCDFSMEAAVTPGEEFVVVPLDTAGGLVQVGAMICYDREFPESARVLMLQGAEIILTPNACDLDDGRVGQFRARAFENMVGVAMANYPAPQNNGRSCAFDAVSFPAPDGGPRETLVVEAGPDEGVFLATFDLAAIRHYRATETWGNAYRKPRAYGLLADPAVHAPFVRRDARR